MYAGLAREETGGDTKKLSGWDQLFAALPPRAEVVDDDYELHFKNTSKCKSLSDHLSKLQTSSVSCGFLYLAHSPDSANKTHCFSEISESQGALGACLRLWSGEDHQELYNEVPLVSALVYAHTFESDPDDEQCFCVVAPSGRSSTGAGSSRSLTGRPAASSR